jgi:hypothetical protein
MKIFTAIPVFVMAFIMLSRCVERFDPPSQGYDDLLVVEAFINNGNEQLDVRLSRSTSLDTTASISETGAMVSILDDSGEEYILYETSSGIYRYPPNLNAQVGKSYQIKIRTLTGNQYASDMVTLRSTPDIDSVYWRFEEKPILGVKGLQVYLDTHDSNNDTWYYRWYYDETWEFRTPFHASLMYENGLIVERPEDINTCWKNIASTTIQLATSSLLSQDIIYKLPLLYIDNTTERLAIRYSVNVKQFALSKEAYQYWKELGELTENLGTLFDPMPFTVIGNIHNVNDPEEVVLGFFDAAEVKEERIFISNLDIPYMNIYKPYQYCEDTIVGAGLVGEMILRGYFLANEIGIDYQLSTQSCVDCRIAGTNEKPDFW